MKKSKTEASCLESTSNKSNLGENFAKRLFISMALSSLIGWLFIITRNLFSTTSIAACLGALFSFFLFQILQYLLKKFLEKKLNFDELAYIKKGLLIMAKDLLLYLFLPLSLFLISMPAEEWNSDPKKNLEFWMWEQTAQNQFYWIFVGGLFIFLYRLKIVKDKLIHLQASFNTEEADKKNIP